VAKNSLRQIIRNWQKYEKTTFMLTSHDLSDVEALCELAILIDHGTKVFDGPLTALKGPLQSPRRIRVTTNDAHSGYFCLFFPVRSLWQSTW
jgi:ABC-2 type transport system ATP-binding protein